eukprot:6181731-Amphidinium_carterae.1
MLAVRSTRKIELFQRERQSDNQYHTKRKKNKKFQEHRYTKIQENRAKTVSTNGARQVRIPKAETASATRWCP